MSNFKLTGANGDTITFDRDNYVLNPELLGMGIPATAVRIDENARYGGVHRYSRRAVRNVDLPITVIGTDSADVESKLRRLARLTQDSSGPTVLTAIRDSGDLTLSVHYTGGAELAYGGNKGGDQWARLLLSFQAPNPYWESADIESFVITSGNTGRGLLPELSKLKVSSSQAIGVISVDNTSDVPVYPALIVTGPVENLSVTLNGEGWGFNQAVAAGEQYTVDHDTATVVDVANVNRYDILNASPKFFAIPPGVSGLLISGTNTNSDTNIELRYNLAFEVVHG